MSRSYRHREVPGHIRLEKIHSIESIVISAVGAVTAVAQNIFGGDPCHDGGDCRYRVYRGHEAFGVPMTLACDSGMVRLYSNDDYCEGR